MIASIRRPDPRRQRGSVLIIVGLMLIVILGFAAFAVDLGYIYLVRNRLQATTDAAALAGAKDIPCCGAGALTTATDYSSLAGKSNQVGGLTVTMATGYPRLICKTSVAIYCGSDSASANYGNTVVVKQEATVPLFFARLFGRPTQIVSAIASASAGGGMTGSLNVVIVLDVTGSMNETISNCGTETTRLKCAFAGAQALLKELRPSVASAALMIYPPVDSSTEQKAYDCSVTYEPTQVHYDSAARTYQIVGLVNDYKLTDTSTSLSALSNLVKTIGGRSGCASVQAQGSVGTGSGRTYYAEPIEAARTLLASAPAARQNAIILLSDGDAGASYCNKSGSSSSDCAGAWIDYARGTNQCRQGVTAAAKAATDGIRVYSIAYDASTTAWNGTTGSCKTDQASYPGATACQTMRSIASDETRFYTAGTSGCVSARNPSYGGSLPLLFKDIANSLTIPRLIPDSAI